MAYTEGEITSLRQASGRVAGKVALITGSTSGIGRASAVLFAWEGAKVVVSGRRTERGEAVAGEIRDRGGEAVYIRADMTREEDIQSLVKTTLDTYGRIDILFNNAGYMMNKPTMEITREDWDRYLNLDAYSYLRMMQLTLPIMEKQGGGVILNCTSLAAVDINIPDNTLYGFMKAGVNHMSRVIAAEYAGKNIRVNTLLPGLIETEMVRNGPNGDRYDFIKTMNPMGRPGTILEAAYAALFLCSDESAYITATSLVIDGGVRGSAGV
ncbi:MAG: glucose 1-dehydrogenase [Clostridiales bacterium]|mgnify:CR=1 FL=1|nr:glucose 1-dehydrogenase [Clostridiales bacterium]